MTVCWEDKGQVEKIPLIFSYPPHLQGALEEADGINKIHRFTSRLAFCCHDYHQALAGVSQRNHAQLTHPIQYLLLITHFFLLRRLSPDPPVRQFVQQSHGQPFNSTPSSSITCSSPQPHFTVWNPKTLLLLVCFVKMNRELNPAASCFWGDCQHFYSCFRDGLRFEMAGGRGGFVFSPALGFWSRTLIPAGKAMSVSPMLRMWKYLGPKHRFFFRKQEGINHLCSRKGTG